MNILLEAPTLKRCCTCHEHKPLADFNRQSKTRDGLRCYCRECQRQANARRRARQKELAGLLARGFRARVLRSYICQECDEPFQGTRKGRCERCKGLRYRAQRAKHQKRRKARLKAENPELATIRKRVERTRERIREMCDPERAEKRLARFRDYSRRKLAEQGKSQNRSFRKRPRRQRSYVGHFSVEEWLSLVARYDSRCLRCGLQCDLLELYVDHIIPITAYPHADNRIGNVQPLCRACNLWKGTRVIDFRPDCSCLLP